jgi:hypothetical protein
MKIKFSKSIVLILVACFLSQLVACGTILHPERKGQRAGQIDPAIAVFDAIGLLFFLIPGVIAFAVDFNNGTIYLPGGKRSSLSPEEMQRIKGQEGVNNAELAKTLRAKGIEVDAADLHAQPLSSHQELDSKMKNFSILYAAVN